MKVLLFLAFTGLLEFAISQTFTVSPQYFSGRPNPTWDIKSNDDDYAGILSAYKAAKKNKYIFPSSAMPSQLGYRGTAISTDAMKTISALVGNNTFSLQTSIVKNGQKLGKIPGSVATSMLEAIVAETAKPVESDKVVKRAVPVYPGPGSSWRTPLVQYCNNCYNYCVDLQLPAKQRFGIPGLGGGQAYYVATNQLTANSVQRGAERDGLVALQPGVVQKAIKSKNTDHYVALVVDPDTAPGAGDGDFHWYRYDTSGTWSHKPGQTAVTNVDGDGNVINDPRNAANNRLGPNYAFVTFMKVDNSTVTVQGAPSLIC